MEGDSKVANGAGHFASKASVCGSPTTIRSEYSMASRAISLEQFKSQTTIRSTTSNINEAAVGMVSKQVSGIQLLKHIAEYDGPDFDKTKFKNRKQSNNRKKTHKQQLPTLESCQPSKTIDSEVEQSTPTEKSQKFPKKRSIRSVLCPCLTLEIEDI